VPRRQAPSILPEAPAAGGFSAPAAGGFSALAAGGFAAPAMRGGPLPTTPGGLPGSRAAQKVGHLTDMELR